MREGETPDFVVNGVGRRYGIEITRLYMEKGSGPPSQQFESLEQRVVDRALILDTEAGGPPLHVVVAFHEGLRFAKARCESLAEDVFTLARSRTS